MPRIRALLADCVLVGAIACATAWTWLYLIGAHALTAGSVIVCTIVSAVANLAVESAVKQVRRRRRPYRLHARPAAPKPRRPA